MPIRSVCPSDRDIVFPLQSDIEPPILEDRVQPRYPESARLASKEGVITIEAIVGEDGCIRETGVLEGVDPVLDVEAARAVTQWKYRPARLRGRPVRVFLTVNVTFRLR